MRQYSLYCIEWAVRINVFVKLSMYGLGKMLNGQFYLKGAIPEEIGAVPLASTTSYDLAWTFFGHSRGYILFIGISQLVGALLFLIPRTKLLGGGILLPILLNIIVVDYYFGVAYGALFSACFYLLSILWVFYLERRKLAIIVSELWVRSKDAKPTKKQYARFILGIIVVFGALFYLEFVGIQFFGYTDR